MVKPTMTGQAPELVLPRFGTPRNFDRETLGHEVGEVARRLRKPLMPWQQHVCDVALEIDPETGELFYEEVIITVPRQSGKTTLILALMIWRCVMMARRLDDMQVVTYLAQSGKMARRKLEREFIPKLRKAFGFQEVPAKTRPVKHTDWKPSLNNNGEHIEFGTGSFLQIEAPTATGSHGDVLDMPVVDEAFARQDDLVEQAVDAATVTRRSPQTFVVSTAGNKLSIWLWRKVLAGRKAIENKVVSRTAYFEWSLPDDADYADPAVWAKYLPALGHTITVRRLQSRLAKARSNPDETDEEGYEPGLPGWLRGYMNRWMDPPQLDSVGRSPEIDPVVWMASPLKDDSSSIVGQCVIGVGISKGGVSGSFVVAGRRADGLAHVETLVRDGELWRFEARLREFVEDWKPAAVAWHNSVATRAFAPVINRSAGLHPDCKPVPLNSMEWKAACAAFVRTVNEHGLRHLGDLLLEDACAGAFRLDKGDGWEWDDDSAVADITPIKAATAALRALESLPVVVEAPFFVY